MNEQVILGIDGPIATISLNRPDKRNALTPAMFERLIMLAETLATNGAIRAVILRGEGPAFCAGLDTALFSSEVADLPAIEERTHGIANLAQRAATVWRDLPVPVIAVLHGAAIGAGLNIALAADLRLVHPATRMALAEINWGLIPAMAGALYLPRLVRDDVMRDLVYTGRAVTGVEAATLGLATHVDDDPDAAGLACARTIASRNPDAIRAAKHLFRDAAAIDERAILALESQLQAQLVGKPNQRDAVARRGKI